MEIHEFIRIMEERKMELIDSVRKMKRRDIVNEILEEVSKFKKNRNNRIFVYYGLRGIGKTTAMIHALSEIDAGYIDGSVLSYYKLNFADVIRDYVKFNKKNVIFVDEITEISNWGSALKMAYDSRKVKIIATGSSSIKIATQKNKISRRAIFKEIPPLSFREFLRIIKGKTIGKVSEDILLSKPSDAYVKAKAEYLRIPDLSKDLSEYMKGGFLLNIETEDISRTSEQILDSIITKDMPTIEGFNISLVTAMEKIVNAISISPPGVTSISKVSEIANCSKTTASSILRSLEIASLLLGISSSKKGSVKMRKEKKFLFSSPAIRYGFIKKLLGENENVGALREDVFVSTIKFSGYDVEYLQGLKKSPDYLIRMGGKTQIFEVGGYSKGDEQVKKGVVVTDSSKLDYKNGVLWVPLYLVSLIL